MREPPDGVDDADVLDLARHTWFEALDEVEHLPLGFGAHHWCARAGGQAIGFLTLDALDARRGLTELHRAYAAAAQLRTHGLEFVHAGLAPLCVPFAGGALSATPWLDGTTPDQLDVASTVALLTRLHAAPPPDRIPLWRPIVLPGFAGALHARVQYPWRTGPMGERARTALERGIDRVATWTARYHELAVLALGRPWVPTHGEPHAGNQLQVGDATLLVDWESLKLAPAERDLSGIIGACGAHLVGVTEPMLELFDLEWRLDEISQYAAWFEAPHDGGAGDRIAIDDLEHEVDRAEWTAPPDA